MDWVTMPTKFGWWFFAPSREDWDLAKPVYVNRIERPEETFFEGRLSPNSPTVRVNRAMGWWYGPVVIPRPR
jgi:hypothetical protein